MEDKFPTAEDCFHTQIINALINEYYDTPGSGVISELLTSEAADAEHTEKLKAFIQTKFDVTLPADLTLRLATADEVPEEGETEGVHYLILDPDWQEKERQGTSRW